MKQIITTETVSIPTGVTVTIKSRTVTVKGPLGEVKRNFRHMTVDMRMEKSKKSGKETIVIDKWFGTYKQKAATKTCATHIENMITGVQIGYLYKMKLVHAHFPINILLTNGARSVEIRNFLGEKHAKRIDLLPGCTAIRNEEEKNEIQVQGIDLENVSRSCALISQIVRIRHKDIRKFLDGIYVSDKGNIKKREEPEESQ